MKSFKKTKTVTLPVNTIRVAVREVTCDHRGVENGLP